ncbi:MAG: GNAT family N-acetyltransferase [Actinomycetota bacterium]|nr:GNAT family N-acetyltransferase [Actinomycetota bacterium]
MTSARDYAGARDIPRLQELVSRRWRAAGEPPVSVHVGDIPWRLLSIAQGDRFRIRLWEDDDGVAAWAWLTRPDELELSIAAGRHHELLDDVLGWAESTAEGPLKVDSLDADTELRAQLESRGYRRLDEDEFFMHARRLAGTPGPTLPEGFILRHVRLPEDLGQRVEVHRSAFGRPGRPSRLTVESYVAVTEAWPYRPELDWVVESPDGSLAAFCLAWLDEDNRVGLLEPVGTHERHRRAGLASAACLGALRALAAAGADHAVVSAFTDEARALYRSIGFAEVGRYAWLRRG